MEIGIIGLGLIGGSIARDLNIQLETTVIGYDANPKHRKIAIETELVEEVLPERKLLEKAQVIILAIPVDAIEQKINIYLDGLRPEQILIDVGSTKERICQAAANHVNRNQYIAAHPLAGTEFSGPTAALKGLFSGKKNIVCEWKKVNTKALELALKLFKSLGLETYFLDPQEHDKHVAYVSHLSHISSFMLGQTVLDLEKDEKQIFNLASTGFASTVRLAKSSPKTWSAIFEKNKDNVVQALDSYIHHLTAFKNQLELENHDATYSMMEKANKIKSVLDGIEKK